MCHMGIVCYGIDGHTSVVVGGLLDSISKQPKKPNSFFTHTHNVFQQTIAIIYLHVVVRLLTNKSLYRC
jgi:hypothetical protein